MKDYNYATLAKYYDILELEGNNIAESFNKLLNNILKRFNIKSVLDMTCGTGDQATYLHKKGYEVVASDFSKEMVGIAQRKYKKLKFYQGDIKTTKYGKFDCVISIFNAIGHLSKKDFDNAIRNVGENLKDKGIYIFDIFNLNFMKKNFVDYKFVDIAKEIEGTKFVRFNKNKFNEKEGIMSMNQETYIQKGLGKIKNYKESWDMQIYSSCQLRKILKRNGFEVIEFLNMNGTKFNKDKNLSILVIARKK